MYCQQKRFGMNWTRTQPLAVLLVSMLVAGILANAAYAQDAPVCPKGKVLRAGAADFIPDGSTCNTLPAGNCGIYVKFTPPLRAACLNQVSVFVQQTNDGAYSPTSACTYLNVLKITSTDFQVQHKGCSDGVPYPVTTPLEIRWVAITTTE
jgi:hypothetical protein